MSQYLILCVDDERYVLDSVLQDLEVFEEHFIIEATESVAEAKEVLKSFENTETKLALILCDHIMPEQTGVSFLVELDSDKQTALAKKALLTGQADLEDTVKAVNEAHLDYFIGKPWKGEELQDIVTSLLTDYMIEHDKTLMQWTSILDTERILNALSDKRAQFGE
ncbi:response regulator [Vibrio sp. FNV 38]|nr:response regulator [Vibrio sp. FNV 38]